ncbi:MAG: hypothetical protein QOE30_1544 [Mycobacterium sp.]|nr:hypothetical protein [Mycobacterium sp.]
MSVCLHLLTPVSTGRVIECPVCGSAELTDKPYENWLPPDELAVSPPYEDFLDAAWYDVCPETVDWNSGMTITPGGPRLSPSRATERSGSDSAVHGLLPKQARAVRTEIGETARPTRHEGRLSRCESLAELGP